ncbi:MAG: PASTA domain-containing protein [Lachnospiraceae bacterium]|jgi:beta-lactam-binding protein with PASTA domain|nr:PASTA domain-containing protein [Lachnospiraceae bacterium]
MKFCINCMAKIRDTKDVCPFCNQQQNIGVKSSFHLSPGITLKEGRYLLGRALVWDDFSVTYAGRDMIEDQIVTIQEYVPEAIARREQNGIGLACISQDVLRDYRRGLKSFVETGMLLKAKTDSLTNIVRVFDCFYENGTGYLIMEHVNGQSVKELLSEEHIFSPEPAKQVICAVLEGVATLHQAGIWHQDIHPGSILLTADGWIKITIPGGYRYQVIGNKVQRTSVVRDGYSAQEQYRNRGEIGAYTDVYEVGAVLFHMITGNRPQSAADRVYKDQLAFSDKMRKELPPNFQNALWNSLQIIPEERTHTPLDFQRELRAKKVDKISGTFANKKTLKKRRTLFVGVSAAVCVCLGAAAVTGLLGPKKRTEYADAAIDILIPNLCGMSVEEAKKTARKAGIKRDNVEEADMLPGDKGTEGTIIQQSPEVAQSLGGNDTVKLTVSGGDERVWLPNMRGKTAEEAKKELKKRNLVFSEEEFEEIYTSDEDSRQVKKGSILAVLLEGEPLREEYREINQGTKVNLRVSLGDYEKEVKKLEVPNLVEEGTVYAAQERLERLGEESGLGLTFSIVLDEEGAKDDPFFAYRSITAQDVEAGTMVRPCAKDGAVQQIKVTLGPKKAKVPEVYGLSEKEARLNLEAAGLSINADIALDYSEEVDEGNAISTYPGAGELLDQGSEVTLSISKGSRPAPPQTSTPTPIPAPVQQPAQTPENTQNADGGWG